MDYADTYTSEIFQKSNCLSKEKSLYTDICRLLQDHGYHTTHAHVWERGPKRFILALVDDPEHANHSKSEDFYSDLTPDDIIVTDSQILRPVLAQVIQLPAQWFGIYAYDPMAHVDLPQRLFSMPINRIDFNRTLLLLRMQMLGRLSRGYVNFNCSDHGQQTDNDRQILWQTYCHQVNQWHNNKYQRSALELSSSMPFRNHDLEHDQVCESGAVNIVVETYSSDFSICISEKIFRALVTPRPWTVLAAPWTVCYLKKLGFDVMDDVVNHGIYDGLRMKDDKIAVFERANHDLTERFATTDGNVDQRYYQQHILPRAHRAAEHNINKLWAMNSAWKDDRSRWLSDVLYPTIQ